MKFISTITEESLNNQIISVIKHYSKYFNEYFSCDVCCYITLHETPNENPIIKDFDSVYKISLGREIIPNDVQRTVFQFSHELTHLIFFIALGKNYQWGNEEDESICTASSLCAVKQLCSSEYLEDSIKAVSQAEKRYREGVPLANRIGYDFVALKTIISNYINKYTHKS